VKTAGREINRLTGQSNHALDVLSAFGSAPRLRFRGGFEHHDVPPLDAFGTGHLHHHLIVSVGRAAGARMATVDRRLHRCARNAERLLPTSAPGQANGHGDQQKPLHWID
jgi:hypothetical protein